MIHLRASDPRNRVQRDQGTNWWCPGLSVFGQLWNGRNVVMATLIPIEGETTEVAAPKDRAALAALLGSVAARAQTAPDGSTWWVAIPEEVGFNERASRFYTARHPPGTTYVLSGQVLYMSAAETNVFNGTPADPMVPIMGKTYDVKEKLKLIGARWDPDKRVWKVPQSRLQEAQDIVRRGP